MKYQDDLKKYAKAEYGVRVKDIQDKWVPQAAHQYIEENDFLNRVQNKFTERKRRKASIKIQSWIRQVQATVAYKKYRDFIVSKIVKIQSFIRVVRCRRVFNLALAKEKRKSAKVIYQFLDGLLHESQYSIARHRSLINYWTKHHRKIKTACQIHLHHVLLRRWKKYKKKKARKEALRKKKLEDAKKKKRRTYQPPEETSQGWSTLKK